jgi:hypothetical protein
MQSSGSFVTDTSLQNEHVSRKIIAHNESVVKNVEDTRKSVTLTLDCGSKQRSLFLNSFMILTLSIALLICHYSESTTSKLLSKS